MQTWNLLRGRSEGGPTPFVRTRHQQAERSLCRCHDSPVSPQIALLVGQWTNTSSVNRDGSIYRTTLILRADQACVRDWRAYVAIEATPCIVVGARLQPGRLIQCGDDAAPRCEDGVSWLHPYTDAHDGRVRHALERRHGDLGPRQVHDTSLREIASVATIEILHAQIELDLPRSHR